VVIKVESMECTAIPWEGNNVPICKFCSRSKSEAMEYSSIQYEGVIVEYMSFADRAKVAVWSVNEKGPCGSEIS
jgi:hypothetical protein